MVTQRGTTPLKGGSMKVQDIMTQVVATCHPWTNLAEVAMMMWNHDCGLIPVLSDQGTVTSVITDRDICMSVATKHRRAEEITVGEVTNGSLFLCSPEDDLTKVLKTMGMNQVRRLPVVDQDGHLVGLVSMNDIVTASRSTKTPTYSAVIETLKAISVKSISQPKVPDLQHLSSAKTAVKASDRLKGKLWKSTKTSGLSS